MNNKISIVVKEGIEDLPECLAGWREVYVVFDRNVSEVVEDIVSHCREVKGSLEIVATEEEKRIDTVMGIVRWLMDKGASRKALVLAVGGGITTDMAGFAACIYKRGVAYANVPTTLLAQVDAAIGGKTGVNVDDYKNMVGVIRQPTFTYICADVLRTLPRRDFLSGAAELVKTFILEDGAPHYEDAVAMLASLRDGTPLGAVMTELARLVEAAAGVKAGVVSRDEFETGERKKLNLGHTFAHALEHEARRTGTDLTHGEAVAVGMILAAELSERVGVAPEGLAERLRRDFVAAGLPVESPFPVSVLRDAMTKDKKAEGDIVHFVLMRGIGDVVFVDIDPLKI